MHLTLLCFTPFPHNLVSKRKLALCTGLHSMCVTLQRKLMKQWLTCLLSHSFWFIFQSQSLLNLASLEIKMSQTFSQCYKLRLWCPTLLTPHLSLPHYILSPHLSCMLLIIFSNPRSGARSEFFLWKNQENISEDSRGKFW